MKESSDVAMSRQVALASLLTAAGLAGVAIWSLRAEKRGVSAGVWFEGITPEVSAEFTERTGSPFTRDELADIESIARAELHAAFGTTCLRLTESPDAMYRLRVRGDLPGLVAGQSRSVPGLGGNGSVSFAAIAASAVAFAPAGINRHGLVAAIGRGIGRTAAHELAHQVLGALALHDERDRLSYEYPDLRREHFYQPLHWTLAAKPLQSRLGRCG
jgi:hypothetical protein